MALRIRIAFVTDAELGTVYTHRDEGEPPPLQHLVYPADLTAYVPHVPNGNANVWLDGPKNDVQRTGNQPC